MTSESPVALEETKITTAKSAAETATQIFEDVKYLPSEGQDDIEDEVHSARERIRLYRESRNLRLQRVCRTDHRIASIGITLEAAIEENRSELVAKMKRERLRALLDCGTARDVFDLFAGMEEFYIKRIHDYEKLRKYKSTPQNSPVSL
jgi:hypothetical protein